MRPLPALTKRFQEQLIVFFATGLYLSFIPTLFLKTVREEEIHTVLTEKKWTGAGLIGTLAGAAFYILAPVTVKFSAFFLLLYIIAAIWISGRAEKILGSHDDCRIVIDEWVGVWVALYGIGPHLNLPLFLAVGLFRLFDVWKGPWGHWLQKLPGGWGVVLDDVGAGILANVCVRLFIKFLTF